MNEDLARFGITQDKYPIPQPARETELWLEKIPGTCPKCSEIRGKKDGYLLFDNPSILAFKSWGMCELCFHFQKDFPEQAAENQRIFQEKLAKEQAERKAEAEAHRFKVYMIDDEKFPSSEFAASVTKEKFTRYPSKTSQGMANKSIRLLTENEAQVILEILKSKNFTCWYDDSEYRRIMNEAEMR